MTVLALTGFEVADAMVAAAGNDVNEEPYLTPPFETGLGGLGSVARIVGTDVSYGANARAPRNGSKSLLIKRVNGVAGAAQVFRAVDSSPHTRIRARVGLNLEAISGSIASLFQFGYAIIGYNAATGKLTAGYQFSDPGAETDGPAIAAGSGWHLLQLLIDHNAGVIDWVFDGVAQPQHTDPYDGWGTVNFLRAGLEPGSSVGATFGVDDWLVEGVADFSGGYLADGPILAHRPTADGVEVEPGKFSKTDPTWWQSIDALDGEQVSQNVESLTASLEVIADTPPLSGYEIEGVFAYAVLGGTWQAYPSIAAMHAYIGEDPDPGDVLTLVQHSPGGSSRTTAKWGVAAIPAPGGGWTDETLADLRFSVGGSHSGNGFGFYHGNAFLLAAAEVAYGAEAPPPPPPTLGTVPGARQLATPAHVVLSPEGVPAYPPVADFVALERTNGGQISLAGRVPAAIVRANPKVFESGSEWLVPIRETGDVLTAGELKRPANNGGAVDLAASGAARFAERQVGRAFYASFGTRGWVSQDAEPHRRGRRPNRAPKGEQVDGLWLAPGTYKYKVTFISAEGESRPSPRLEVEITGGDPDDIQLTDIPRGPKWVTGRNIYRTEVDGDTYKWLVTLNATDTEYLDTQPDGALGDDAPPTSWAQPEIGLDVKETAIVWTVERGATLYDGQLAGVIFPLSGEETFSYEELEIEHKRDSARYTLRLEAATDDEAAFALVESISLDDDGPGTRRIKIPGGKSALRLSLRVEANIINAQPFELIVRPRQFGRAPDDTFTAADVMRDGCAEIGVSARYVVENGTPAMPADFIGTTRSEIFDLMALYTGGIWLLYREGHEDVCYFGPTGRRKWIAAGPGVVPDLLPRLPYSRVVLAYQWEDGVVTGEVEAIADPNPLGRIVTAPPLALDLPGSPEFAQAVAQRLADDYVRDTRVGTLTFTRLMDDNGLWWDGHHAAAGDDIYVPSEGVWVTVDELEHRDPLVVATVGDVPLKILERYNARKARRLAARR